MPSRGHDDYVCSRCARFIRGGTTLVTVFNPLLHHRTPIWRLCDACTDAMREWVNATTWSMVAGGAR